MRRHNWIVAGAMLSVSGILHAAAVGQLVPRTEVSSLNAGGGEAVPSLGDSFADMAAGSATQPVTPMAAVAVQPVPAPALSPVAPPLAPLQPTGAQPPDIASLSVPGIAPSPNATAVATAPEPTVTLRPKPRPSAKPAASGNAERNAKKGSTQGMGGAVAAPQAKGNITNGDGGAAEASGYGTKVLRKIAGTRKVKAPAKGRAVVAFAIALDGAIQSAKIVKSSGSPALDAAALDHIRRAAPFPPPPESAQRRFSFEFVGKP